MDLKKILKKKINLTAPPTSSSVYSIHILRHNIYYVYINNIYI